MNEYRIKISVRNNLILRAIESAGFKSCAEFSRYAGMRVTEVSELVSLRVAPITKFGEFTDAAKRLMETLALCPSDLWTDEQLYISLKRNSASAELGAEEVKALMGQELQPKELEAPSSQAENQEIKNLLGTILAQLPERHRKVIELRYWEDKTYEECASELGVSTERARQIEMKVLRQLRSPVKFPALHDARLISS